MECKRCGSNHIKQFGFNKHGKQRHRCKICGRIFTETSVRCVGDLRVDAQKVYQVAQLLAESVGVRACERLSGLNRRTILNILETAGQKCKQLLDTRLTNLKVGHLEIDELWSFVGCKQQSTVVSDILRGDQYLYLAVSQDSKLLVHYHVAKRTKDETVEFLSGLKNRLSRDSFDLTTDNYAPYLGHRGAVFQTFRDQVNYGTETKHFAKVDIDGPRRYSPVVCKWVKRRVEIGEREINSITINHTERMNLNVRLFNRRFSRLTLGYSKTLKYHKYSVALLVAHFNFCRTHSSLKNGVPRTPAMAHGLTDHVWTIQELLA